MSPRAAAMAPEERREALIEATLPLLHQHGRAVSTRQIAEAAGVAEGTIFRVFESKEQLVDAVIVRAWDPHPFLEQLETIDQDQPLRDRLLDLVTLLQERFRSIFALMGAVGMVAPPEELEVAHGVHWRVRGGQLMREVIGDDADALRVSADQLIHLIRLLTFSASHHDISDGQPLTPVEIVDTLLYGTMKETR